MVRSRKINLVSLKSTQPTPDPQASWIAMDNYLETLNETFTLEQGYFTKKIDDEGPDQDEYELIVLTYGRIKASYGIDEDEQQYKEPKPTKKRKTRETDEEDFKPEKKAINFFVENFRPFKFQFDDNVFPASSRIKILAESLQGKQKWSSDKFTLFDEENDYRTAIFENAYVPHAKKVKFLLGFTQKKGENYIEACLIRFDHEGKRSFITGWGNNHSSLKRKFTMNLIKDDGEVLTSRKAYRFDDGQFTRDFCFWLVTKAIHYWNKTILLQRITAPPTVQTEESIYYDRGIEEKYNTGINIMERPLQGINDDVCFECAAIAVAIDMNRTIPINFLEKDNLGNNTLQLIMKRIRVNCRELSQKNLNTVLENRSVSNLFLMMNQSKGPPHCCYCVKKRGEVALLYNSWRKKPSEAKMLLIGGTIELKDSAKSRSQFFLSRVFLLSKDN